MTATVDFDERLTRAASSSDLTVSLERRGDVDLLIAAGKAPFPVGRMVYQLMTEWDGCAKPKRLTHEDIQRLAETMPRITMGKKGRKVQALDLPGARAAAEEFLATERRRILGRLKSLPALMDPHAGLLPWVVARGMADPSLKLLDVLGWWADRNCTACNGTMWQVLPGTNVQSKTPCKVCHGSGRRPVPHGEDGRAISEHIERNVDRARAGARRALKSVPLLKHFAAGKV